MQNQKDPGRILSLLRSQFHLLSNLVILTLRCLQLLGLLLLLKCRLTMPVVRLESLQDLSLLLGLCHLGYGLSELALTMTCYTC